MNYVELGGLRTFAAVCTNDRYFHIVVVYQAEISYGSVPSTSGNKVQNNSKDSEASVRKLLRQVPAFEGLDDTGLDRIGARSTSIHIPRGTVLIEEGDQAEALYIVLRGRFIVLAGDTPIAEISVGEPIGELAFFAGGTRTANVVAARNSQVLSFSRDVYDALQAEVPELANGILASVSQRLAKNTRSSPKLKPRAGKTVGVLSIGILKPDKRFLEKIVEAIGGNENWVCRGESDCPEDLLENAQSRENWLEELEQNHDGLVLISIDSKSAPGWTSFISDNCDTVFLVGAADEATRGAVAKSDIEQKIYNQTLPSNLNLVIWRDASSVPITHSANWLSDRNVALHHHIALDSDQDFARLSRFIRGTAVGLVLCGGGAFGTAHMGALKALNERGFEFDMVGGTSVGAAMAGALAIGLEPDRVMDLCEEIFIKSKAMSRLTIPFHSVIDHLKLDSELRKHFSETDVRDTPLNYFAVATNLSNNNIFVMREGPIWQAVRASGSLPGIFPPLVTGNEEVLIDGGLIDNVPIAIMRDLKPGPNVVFNFIASEVWKVEAKYSELPGRLGSLGKLFRRKKSERPQFPSVFTILTRSMVVNARRLLEQTNMDRDVLLQISTLPGMSFLDWTKGRQLYEAAYVQMSQALDSLSPIERQLSDQDRFARLALVSKAIVAAEASVK